MEPSRSPAAKSIDMKPMDKANPAVETHLNTYTIHNKIRFFSMQNLNYPNNNNTATARPLGNDNVRARSPVQKKGHSTSADII